METLPAFVKSRAMGGSVGTTAKQEATYTNALTALANPEDTFGLLRTLLEGLESRLNVVQRNVEKRNALANATPSIWPAHGWLTSTMGRRTDPMTGGDDYHPGLDIAGDKGQPVYATAAGVVTHAGDRVLTAISSSSTTGSDSKRATDTFPASRSKRAPAFNAAI